MKLIIRTAEWKNPQDLIDKNIKFMDITDHIDLANLAQTIHAQNEENDDIPVIAKRQEEVNALIELIDKDRMKKRLNRLTKFENRYYRSETGVESAKWLKETVEQIVQETGAAVVNYSLIDRQSKSSLILGINLL